MIPNRETRGLGYPNPFSQHVRHQADPPLVVVVDDHEDSLGLAVYVLESIPCRHMTVANATQLLDLLKKIQPDVILLDILLPDMNGFELMDTIRHEFSSLNIPIIAVTALSSRQDQQIIQGKGFADYLIKPFDLEMLRQMLLHYLGIPNSLQVGG